MDSVLNLIQNPSWDIIAFLAITACGFFWGITYGKKALGMIIIGVYVLFAIWPFVPANIVTDGRAPVEIWAFRSGIFLALLMFVLLFLFRTFKGALFSEGIWWEILILSILGAGLLTTILLKIAPPEIITANPLSLSPFTLQFFSHTIFTTWWTVLPILGVLFL